MEELEMTISSHANVVIDVADEKSSDKEGKANENLTSGFEKSVEPKMENEAENTAGLLLESAKKEGFFESLVHLAKGDFEDSQNDPEVSSDLIKIEPENDEEEVIEGEEAADTEKAMLLTRIDELESQVADVLEENEKLRSDVKRAEDRAELSQEALLAMFAYLYELAKKEEDEKKKIGLFEALIDLVSKFMLTVIDPEGEFEKKEEQDEKKESEKEPVSIEKIMQFMKERTSGRKMKEMTKDTAYPITRVA